MRMRKAVASGLTALLATAVLAGCGDAPDSSASGGDGGEETPAALDFLPCIVSDAGGFDDKSFNQLGYEGVEQAADELGVEFKAVESNSENDYAPNIESLVAEGCNAIVTVGFALSAATIESAAANPDIEYILIDDAADADFDGKADAANIKPLLYDTAQAAFLAGYAAARLLARPAKVGTYGGQPFPTVTIFMDGFKQGVDYYNEEKGKNVKVVGWDGKDGSLHRWLRGQRDAPPTPPAQLLDQDVDVILPVGGPIYQGALTAIADAGADVALIGVDADFFETDPNTQDVVLTSILKNMKVSTYEAVMAAGNERVRLHAVRRHPRERRRRPRRRSTTSRTRCPTRLAAELEEIKAGIIDGSIAVTSYLSP